MNIGDDMSKTRQLPNRTILSGIAAREPTEARRVRREVARPSQNWRAMLPVPRMPQRSWSGMGANAPEESLSHGLNTDETRIGSAGISAFGRMGCCNDAVKAKNQ